MDRRRFLECVAGCGCLLAVAGCGGLREERKGNGMAADAMDEPGKETTAGARKASDTGEWNVSTCGLNCARCDLFQQGKCGSCRGPADRHWSADCKMLACSQAKGHRYCFECAEFPCQILQDFASDGYPHHRVTVENLKKMREVGLEKWIAGQEKVMFCPGWKV